MSHANTAVKEEDDQADRCSSMESEALQGYVETQSVGVGIAKDETMLLDDQNPDDNTDVFIPKVVQKSKNPLPQDLRAESEITSVRISQKLEIMRDEEE